MIKRSFWSILLICYLLQFCISEETKVTKSSSVDEIIDASSEKIYFFLLKNQKVLREKKIRFLPFEIIKDGTIIKNSNLGIQLQNSVIGYLGRSGEVKILNNRNETSQDSLYDYSVTCVIQVRDRTLSFNPRILSKSDQIIHSTIFLMPKNPEIIRYIENIQKEQTRDFYYIPGE
ncbi:MAG: hypothetical protein N3A69_12670 [Leptospiraceae bacterium]|nr:hypothetical protein [Leptospiraceae bacterium]